eukprot:TRINITY_DN3736_c0_g4_i2.p1 TRINITY_DN3736_c0_g4~~TRINITY_DN3736_c0_g4_i2.p1  ORF type:complete len:637 (-),score=150.63 TRINITY_DN3736_c0_g4_i2:492-2372(-)
MSHPKQNGANQEHNRSSEEILSVIGKVLQSYSSQELQVELGQHPHYPHGISQLSSEGLSNEELMSRLEALILSVRAAHPSSLNSVQDFNRRQAVLQATADGVIPEALPKLLAHALLPLHPLLPAVSMRIQETTSSFLRTLLKLPANISTYFSRDDEEAWLLVLRAALNKGFPTLATSGYPAINSIPVIYTSASRSVTERLRLQLFLPSESIRNVPINKKFGSSHCMNVETLQAMIEEDKNNGRTPLLIFASACSGFVDDIHALRRLADDHSIWLHVEGDALAMLVSNTVPPSIGAVIYANSFSITPGRWFDFVSSTTCTFVKNKLNSFVTLPSSPFIPLPLWLHTLRLGHNYIKNSITRAADLSSYLARKLSSNKSINLDSHEIHLSVLFRYSPSTNLLESLSTTAQATQSQSDEERFEPNLLNKLNKQLLVDLNETATPLGIELIAVNDVHCFSFNPLKNCELLKLSYSFIDKFVTSLGVETNLIDATMRCRAHFRQAVIQEGLEYVEVPNFVGLGAVRYVPTYLATANLAPEVQSELDSLNAALVVRLQQDDQLFSEGRTIDSHVCVCIGVDTKPITPEIAIKYPKLIKQTADTLETNSKIVENIAELVLKGIHEAEEEIQRQK